MRRLFDVNSKFMRGLIHIADCICLSVLWLIFSIPIVTMGASSAALYAAVYKYIRRDEGYLWRTFWEAFKENLKRSTLVCCPPWPCWSCWWWTPWCSAPCTSRGG